MRLTGVSDFAARTVRTGGASAGEKVAVTAKLQDARTGEGVGVSTVLGSAEGAPAFDAERVAEIRKAIEENRYPLVPAKIADAVIAAKLYGIVGT